MLPKKLQQKLDKRIQENALRALPNPNELVDFSSNDYLGFGKNKVIFDAAHSILKDQNIIENGATGSRLLSGNHQLYDQAETFLASFHQSDSALIFNSGYDANIGFFSSVPQRGDIVLYDEYIHASIRDGITMSTAKSYKFKHNDLYDLSRLIERVQGELNNIYIVTESVFSMDGDTPDLKELAVICKKHNCHLVVDEAHAIGVFKGGLIQNLDLQTEVFARIITFGKAMGCHGAAILGPTKLKSYLVNFARSLIYTTGLPPHSLATILSSYNQLASSDRDVLHGIISYFNEQIQSSGLRPYFTESNSTIHCAVISGNKRIKFISSELQQKGFSVKPILSPTVSKNEERLRFCLHSYNTKNEIDQVLKLLKENLK